MSVCISCVLYFVLYSIFHASYFILHAGSVINMIVGTAVGLLGLFLCLLGHRLFDFGKCGFVYLYMPSW